MLYRLIFMWSSPIFASLIFLVAWPSQESETNLRKNLHINLTYGRGQREVQGASLIDKHLQIPVGIAPRQQE